MTSYFKWGKGCCKTSLIIKLSQIINNWEKLVEIININPSITGKEIIKIMKEMNAKTKNEKYQKKELWVFFVILILAYHYHF